MRDCEECGRENRRGGRWCAACHRRRYYRTPNGRAAIIAAIKRYEARHPEKRRAWVRNWQFRVGLYNPDLRALRAANKRVEQALAEATRRERLRSSSERSSDDDLEWGD